MRDGILFRLSGLSAIAGGILRIANAFTTNMPDPGTLQILYFATDVLLIFGLIGIYLNCRKSVGIVGLSGFIVAVIGILLVRSAGLVGYPIAAATVLIGTVILGAGMLMARKPPRLPAYLWIFALAAGVAGALVPAFTAANEVAGVAFGAGFIVAGANLFRAA